MKYLLSIIVVLFLSCTKHKEGECWTCQVKQPDGNMQTKKGCGPIPSFLDANGNVPFHTCQLR